MVLALLSLIATALAQGVVLLDQGSVPEQERFHQELALTLQSVKLQPAPEGFGSAPLTEQLGVVRPLLERAERQAVIWLGSDEAKLWVSVAFVADERAVIRVIDLPREPDPLPRLALAVRELAAEAYASEPKPLPLPAPPPVPPTPPAAVWWGGGSVGALVPWEALAGGPRGALGLQVHREVGGLEIGGEVLAQAGSQQRRLGLGLDARWIFVSAGVSADWEQGPYELPLQPRAGLGLIHRWDAGLLVHARLQIHPIRDKVALGGQRLYDTGWTSLGIFLGWERKISKR